jgi:hypothetical protein
MHCSIILITARDGPLLRIARSIRTSGRCSKSAQNDAV